MRNFLIIISVVIICTVIAWKIYAYNSLWKKLNEKIDSGQDIVMVSELTDFDWDMVCVLSPYSIYQSMPEHELKKLIPFAVKQDHLPDMDNDYRAALVFIQNNIIKNHAYYPDSKISKAYKNNCIKNSSAKFIKNNNKLSISE